MKKKQKINKAVNYGEWILLGLTALFLCVLFALRERPAPERGITVRTASNRFPSGESGSASAAPEAESAPAAVPGTPPADAGNASISPETVPDADSAVTLPDSAAATPSVDAQGRVNLNTADLAELCALPGIGDALAGRIIAYREEHGPFARPEDVMRVSGIGQGKFDAVKNLITV